jgi:hypothetical protein
MEGSSSSSLKLKAEWGPAICMVLIEVFTTGQMLLTKVVVDAGLFVFALLTYRFLLGTLLVVPLAIIFERSVLRSRTHASCYQVQLVEQV